MTGRPPRVPDWWSLPATPPEFVSSDPNKEAFGSLFHHCGRPEARPDDHPTLPPGVYPMKFDRSSVVVLMDLMESVMKGCDRVMETSHVKWVLSQCTLLVSRMTSSWKRVIHLPSPDAAFWDIIERARFDWA